MHSEFERSAPVAVLATAIICGTKIEQREGSLCVPFSRPSLVEDYQHAKEEPALFGHADPVGSF